jgi:hypothetical protein
MDMLEIRLLKQAVWYKANQEMEAVLGYCGVALFDLRSVCSSYQVVLIYFAFAFAEF